MNVFGEVGEASDLPEAHRARRSTFDKPSAWIAEWLVTGALWPALRVRFVYVSCARALGSTIASGMPARSMDCKVRDIFIDSDLLLPQALGRLQAA